MCCNVLQRFAVCCSGFFPKDHRVNKKALKIWVTVCCRNIAACCSALRCQKRPLTSQKSSTKIGLFSIETRQIVYLLTYVRTCVRACTYIKRTFDLSSLQIVCVCVCTHVRTYVRPYVCTCVYIHKKTHPFVELTNLCFPICIYMCIYTHHMHLYIHTNTYAYHV